ncbi:hypothetical protein PP175_21710 [Aneurinibacillus sp. Ricciae_BoGa-3]|uniref:hypothetical protein n=1 Tax=Aneurinibacillus sp. Ricciae_BoGa-3 TaxID=3022697 RepID=UPI002341985C|nr:hypothetical protein [Aneurinibacillus sp. Ricciae_BoGa-3]WCK53908.1 hypothetical protein PP175_21710 [Aneurinibacillus sp. Ricciae_BoGa-3]
MSHNGNHGIDPRPDKGNDGKGHQDSGNHGKPHVNPVVPHPSHAAAPDVRIPRR